MKNKYTINDYTKIGIPSIEVHGEGFHYRDLYELVGRNRFMTTFNLKEGSSSQNQFGKNVLGIIYYSFKQVQELEGANPSGVESDLARIRIDSPDIKLSQPQKHNLKYKGIEVADIESLSFLPYINQIERFDTGEKKVPNIIELKVDCSGIDPDILYLNYVGSKINDDVELIPFEKEKFIGITLGINDGHIDSRILERLGFNIDSVKANFNIWYYLFKVKERRGILSKKEEASFSEIKSILTTDKILKLLKEIKSSGVYAKDPSDGFADTVKKITDQTVLFSPGILMHGKKQIYWDVDSYLHIVMRHVNDFQVGNFKNKNHFSYKAEDLRILIEKVIQRVESEIQAFFSDNPRDNFRRAGSMSVEFNGEHYNLIIDITGRLVQFHPVGDRKLVQ
jgi:hypothetical protein